MPALSPPPGVESNFENPQSRSSLTVIPSAAIVGITIILVFTRMYTKVYILKSVGWDDCTSGVLLAPRPLQVTDPLQIRACLQQYVRSVPSRSSAYQLASCRRWFFLAS